ncbi:MULTISPECIES: DUF305 domain-containing protein [Humibacter]|jgi:uncharacterized protein (DUF305 family)|uniref:DUF305 domain-containing protein n=1 Tax=Humibacter ginsenosidimutans TaxID=2599293 RepID=A0A5B8M6Y8_9MICO|nr:MULTISPECIES: DUF305 domain-containing protein [Humibacter]QDZ15919.1 DUF305 domain-containing protein [Humibacter ginsenosidimutans]
MKFAPRAALAGVVLAAGGLLAGCTSSGMGDMPGMSHSSSTPAGTHNAQDAMFAQMMIVHHQGAIEMAGLAPTRAASAQVKDLAVKIKDAQQPEIDEMKAWLKGWGEPLTMPEMGSGSSPSPSDMSGMDMSTPMPTDGAGMNSMPGMTPQDMAQLKAATGPAFDKAFLSLMIQHHQGAIDMAKQEQSGGKDTKAKKLADNIVNSQSQEVTEMQAMLTSLG